MNGSDAQLYDQHFFRSRQAEAMTSAGRIIDLLLSSLQIGSVVDVGCANGVWLSVFDQRGVNDSVGIDGPWVQSADLLIPEERFLRHNLSETCPPLHRRFDLAISIEVAEHLPPERADSFVSDIAELSDHVLFSGAVPDQGGTGHVNEQWQSYWAHKFLDRGYRAYDIIRPSAWRDPEVNIVHAQNLILYMKDTDATHSQGLLPVPVEQYDYLDVVHPDLYQRRLMQCRNRRFTQRLRRRIGKMVSKKK